LTPDGEVNLALVRALHQARMTFNGVYLDELSSHIEKVDAEPGSNDQAQAGNDTECHEFNENEPFNPDQEIPA
jgi:hypothetical protein